MGDPLQMLFESVVAGKKEAAEANVSEALAKMIPPDRILNEGLIAGMKEVGRLFEAEDFFVPEMLLSAKVMQAGLNILRPSLVKAGTKAVGRVVIGSVQGDLHDIGKNLVAMMLEGAGFEILDLGTNVPPAKFAEAAREHRPQVLAMSALLTTTVPGMRATLDALKDMALRDRMKVIVGGAPVTEGLAREIGADGYAPDASRAASLALRLIGAGSRE